ncbi:MAG TPA: hypothetical protein VHD31_02280 [Candidatus Paceibacterota bacterium]|nr:hypothetical protein [Candidatus Paceibacterota bacterium]
MLLYKQCNRRWTMTDRTETCGNCGREVPIGGACNPAQARDCANMAGSGPRAPRYEDPQFVHDEDDEE